MSLIENIDRKKELKLFNIKNQLNNNLIFLLKKLQIVLVKKKLYLYDKVLKLLKINTCMLYIFLVKKNNENEILYHINEIKRKSPILENSPLFLNLSMKCFILILFCTSLFPYKHLLVKKF